MSIIWTNLVLRLATVNPLEHWLIYDRNQARKLFKVDKNRLRQLNASMLLGKLFRPWLIFKVTHTNTAWVPAHTPPNWRFSTSNSGWTSDSHGYEWISTIFEPSIRPEDPTTWWLLVVDGHSRHITANLIALCIEPSIDLCILLAHYSHFLQQLDISVFLPLKRTLSDETNAAARLNRGRISRIE